MTEPAEHDPMWANDTAALPTRHAWTANMHRFKYVRPSVPQTKSFSDEHLSGIKIDSLIICYATEIKFFLLMSTFRTFRSFTSLGIFFDGIYVALGASFLLHFARTCINNSISSTYGLGFNGRWWTWSWAIRWYGFTFSIARRRCCYNRRLTFCKRITNLLNVSVFLLIISVNHDLSFSTKKFI